MLDLVHVSKTFNPGTVNEKKALDDVTLHLEKGDFVTLIGSNGAGKSTLMAAVAGEFYPDAGRVSLDGRDVTFVPDHRRARQIGRLFQDPLKGTAPHMTIEENMALAYLRAARRSGVFSTIRAKDRAAFREQLAALGLGLEDRLSQPVGLLSGGQRQALTLLMATLVTPKLLLLDEHTAALDPSTAEKVLSLTEQIVAEKGHHLHDGDTQYILGAFSGQPHRDDGCRAHCAAAFRRAARSRHSGKPSGAVPRAGGQKPG